MATPWMKFYPSDWRADPVLRLCSMAARGLWVEMLCIMHEATPYGSLLVNGRRLDKRQLASLVGMSDKECTALLIELEGNGVFSRDEDGTIYSRRMRRDADKAERDKANGKLGGNPRVKGVVNPEVKAQIPEARSQKDADAVDAREPLVSQEAQTLADELLVIAGHDLKFVPPGWCGAGMRVQSWLSQGWQREPILAAVKAAASRKRGPPANSVQFFEKAIAEEIARQSAPLPVVEVREAEKITVTHGNSQVRSGSSLIASIDRKLAAIEAEARADIALPEGDIRLLPG